MALKLLELHK